MPARPISLGFALVAGALVSGLVVPVVTACSGDEATTTSGARVVLATRFASRSSAGATIAASQGYTVRLTRAAVALDALYYFDGEPPLARGEPLLRLLAPRQAFAHPGHYDAGNALGEMLEPTRVELFTTPALGGVGRGVTGFYRSGTVRFAASDDPVLGGVALAEGRADKPGSPSRFFRLRATHADLARSAAEASVRGCVFESARVETNGTVLLTIDPGPWFMLVDFEDVEPGSAAAPTDVAAGSTAQLGFALGVSQLSAYRFSFVASEGSAP